MQFNPEMLVAGESQRYDQSQNVPTMNTKQNLKQYQIIQSISEAPEREESSALHLDEDYFHSSRFQSQILKASNASPESDKLQKASEQQKLTKDKHISKTIDQIQQLIRVTQDRMASSERTSQRISVQTDTQFSEGGQSAEDRNSLKMNWQETLQQSLYSSNSKLKPNQLDIQIEKEKGIILQQNQLEESIKNREVLITKEGSSMFQEKQPINTKIIENNNKLNEEFSSNQPYKELEITNKREYIPLSMQIMNQIQSPKQESSQKQKEQSLIQKDRSNHQKLIEKQKQLVLKRYEELTKKQQQHIQNKQISQGLAGTQKQGSQRSNESKNQQLLREQQTKHGGELRLETSPGKQQSKSTPEHNGINGAEIGPSTPKSIYLSLDQFKLKQPVNPPIRSPKIDSLAVNAAISKETYKPSKVIPKIPENVPSVLKKGSQYQNECSLELIRKMMEQKDFKELEVPEESVQNYQTQIIPKKERESVRSSTLEGAELDSGEINGNQMDSARKQKGQDMNQNIISQPKNERKIQDKEGKQEKLISNESMSSQQYVLTQNKAASTSNLSILKEQGSLSIKHHTQMSQDSLLRSLEARKKYTFASNGEKCLILAKEQTSNVTFQSGQNPTGGNVQFNQDQIVPYEQYNEIPMRQSEILLMEEQEAFEEILQQKALDKYKVIDSRQESSQNRRIESQQLGLQQQMYASEMHSAEQQFHQSYVDNSNLSSNIPNVNNQTYLKNKEPSNQSEQQRGTFASSSSQQQRDLIKQKDLRWLDYSALERNSLWLQVRNQNRMYLQQQQQSKELAQCTFKPTVNTLHNKRNNILPSNLTQINDISGPQLNHTINSALNITNNRVGNVSPKQLTYQQTTTSPQNKILKSSNILNESNSYSSKSTNNRGQSQSKDVSGHLMKNTNRSFSSNANSNTNRSVLALPKQQQTLVVSSVDRSILSKSISPTQRSMLGGSSSFQSTSSKNKRVQSSKSYSELSRLKKSQNNLPFKIEDPNIIRSPGGFSSPGLFFPPSRVVSSQIGLMKNVNILKMPGKGQKQRVQ